MSSKNVRRIAKHLPEGQECQENLESEILGVPGRAEHLSDTGKKRSRLRKLVRPDSCYWILIREFVQNSKMRSCQGIITYP
jgi:hypothetical protein